VYYRECKFHGCGLIVSPLLLITRMHFISILKGASALISMVETCFKNSRKDAIGLGKKKTKQYTLQRSGIQLNVGSSNMHLYRHTTFYVLPLSFDYLENINHFGTSQKCAVLFGAGMTFPSTRTKMARFFLLSWDHTDYHKHHLCSQACSTSISQSSKLIHLNGHDHNYDMCSAYLPRVQNEMKTGLIVDQKLCGRNAYL